MSRLTGDEQTLDLASRKKWEVVPHKHAVAFWVLGNCMSGDGISDGYIVLVDPERRPEHWDIEVFFVSNERGGLDQMLKRLDLSNGTRLCPVQPGLRRGRHRQREGFLHGGHGVRDRSPHRTALNRRVDSFSKRTHILVIR